MATQNDLGFTEMRGQRFDIVCATLVRVLRKVMRRVLLLLSVIQHITSATDCTYRTAIAQTVRGYDPQARIHEHWDLVAPSHRDIGEAMDLEVVS